MELPFTISYRMICDKDGCYSLILHFISGMEMPCILLRE